MGKRPATSFRDPTLNKRLKSAFKNIGPPKQRVSKIPKGRAVPDDLMPIKDMVTGTTMLKALGRNGSGNLVRSKPGDQLPRNPRDGHSEGDASLARTKTDPSGTQEDHCEN